MFTSDMTPIHRAVAGFETVLAVGWLDPAGGFPTGETTEQFREKLHVACTQNRVRETRSPYLCPFCRPEDGIVCGSCEVHIPGPDGRVLFAVPSLIYHYVTAHRYRPPDEFVSAVEQFTAR